MNLTGKQMIGFDITNSGDQTFQAVNPADGSVLEPVFFEAAARDVDDAFKAAAEAFTIYRKKTNEERAAFLDKIADEIMALGDKLIERCMKETGLPQPRLIGERGRTVNQLKMFAQVVREGSWVDARIDTAIPDRQPVPKPDIRRMLVPLGPAGIFGASNFPLAFSVAGGDAASALAAGCPVVVKAHPAHPGTSELVGHAVIKSAKETNMPHGVFSLLHGRSNDVGKAMVNHPLAKAIGFTGSFAGGKALFDAAMKREEPIPVYAEMGSTNPVFLLPGALKEKAVQIAAGLAASVTLGVGQFCTNPGVVIVVENGEPALTNEFVKHAAAAFAETAAGTMLTENIKNAYESGLETHQRVENVTVEAVGKPGNNTCSGVPHLLKTTAANFLNYPELADEVFGPSTVLVIASDKSEALDAARALKGHLTATLHGTGADLEQYRDLTGILETKVGRLLLNGFPTGVEVCASMQHGGPFPATTDSRTTSVGTAAIVRFARPVCYQGFSQEMLPEELKDDNPLKIRRLVDGKYE